MKAQEEEQDTGWLRAWRLEPGSVRPHQVHTEHPPSASQGLIKGVPSLIQNAEGLCGEAWNAVLRQLDSVKSHKLVLSKVTQEEW